MKFVKIRGRHLRLDEISLTLYTLYEYVGVYDSSNDLQRRLKYLALGIQLFSREKLTAYQFVDFHNRKQVRLKRIISILDAFFIIAGLALFIVFKRYIASAVVCLPPLAIRFYFYNRSVRNNFLHTSKVLENSKFTDFLTKVALDDDASFKLLEEKLLAGEFQNNNELSVERNTNILGQQINVENCTEAVPTSIKMVEDAVKYEREEGAMEIVTTEIIVVDNIETVNGIREVVDANDVQLIAIEEEIVEDVSENAPGNHIEIVNTQTAPSSKIEEFTNTPKNAASNEGHDDLKLEMLPSEAQSETPKLKDDREVSDIGPDSDNQEIVLEEITTEDNSIITANRLEAFQEQLIEIASRKNQFNNFPMAVVIDYFAIMCCPACKNEIPQMTYEDFVKFLNVAFLGMPLEEKIKLDRFEAGITSEIFHQFMKKAGNELYELENGRRTKYSLLLSQHFEGFEFEKVKNNFRTNRDDRLTKLRNQYKVELQSLQRLQS